MTCEKCWADAFIASYGRSDTDQSQEYHRLLQERAQTCSPCCHISYTWQADDCAICDFCGEDVTHGLFRRQAEDA